MKGFRARFFEEPVYFARNVVTLAVLDDDRGAYLMPDGTWLSVEEGTVPPKIGIELPAAAVEAIAQACAEFQGHTSHADTEARILREWLAVEQRRVNQALNLATPPSPESPA